MSDRVHTAIAAQYDSEEAAEADFERLHRHYQIYDKHGSFDAAVVRRDREGKIDLLHRDFDAELQATGKGLGMGIAGGLLIAVFPAVALGGALLVAGGTGAGIGAIAGHVSERAARKDLEDIGETLKAGSAGIVAVVDPADGESVQALLSNATQVTVKRLSVDDEKLDEDLRDAYE